LEPKLALTYNSKGGNGLLGMGWGLSGLSAVTRCARTVVQDGTKAGINFDSNDRFCLDGQRLVMIAGTSYGANGAEYRTERETFTKVISNGQVSAPGNGPQWFQVWTKSGLIMEYGNDAPNYYSRIEAQGRSTVRVWALNKISDKKGNYLTVTYAEDNPNGDFYPTRIDYNYAGTPPTANASVQFVPDPATRPDVTPSYVFGSVVKTTKRLSNIKTYVGTTLVKDYRLAYAQSTTTGRSRLTSITECAGDQVSCLSPTTLYWQDGTNSVQLISSNPSTGGMISSGNWTAYIPQVADVNGDGRSDIILTARSPSLWAQTLLGNGDGTYQLISSNPSTGGMIAGGDWSAYFPQIADVNGDGKSDIVLTAVTTGGLWVYTLLGNGDGTYQLISSNPSTGGLIAGGNFTAYTPQVADINGDGRSDIVLTARSPSLWVLTLLGNGDGTFQLISSNPSTGGMIAGGDWTAYKPQIADVNGDGKSDIVLTALTAGGFWVYTVLGNGDGTYQLISSNPSTGGLVAGGDWHFYNPDVADVNGDGRSDIVLTARSPSLWVQTLLGNGDGTYQLISSNPSNGGMIAGGDWTAYRLRVADVNGDGRSDIVFTAMSPGLWVQTLLGNGDGTYQLISNPQVSSADWSFYLSYSPQVADITGDGRSDVALVALTASGFWAYSVTLAGGLFPDLLSGVVNGLGASTTITYKPLTTPIIYTKFNPPTVYLPLGLEGLQYSSSSYPIVDLQLPLYIVSNTADGVGQSHVTNYTYYGLKAHQQGAGLLGFAYVQAADVQTGITTTTAFRQDYPFQGLPNGVAKVAVGPSNVTLDKVLSTWTTNPALNALTYNFATGRYHRSDLTNSVESGNDLNGAVLPTVTTTSNYDAYGNASSVAVSTGDGFSKTTANTYFDPDTVNWILGRIKQSTVTSVTP
jgi:hypothetical protein